MRQIMIVSNSADSTWLQLVGEALQDVGELQIVSETDAQARIVMRKYDLLIVDATAISGDAARLVEKLRNERPLVPIIVATTSPTWNRARQVFLAGAADYIRKSLDKETIITTTHEILERFSKN